MSPEEVELLQDAGRSFLANISALVTQSILYGLYLAIFAFGIRTFLKKQQWTKYIWSLFGFVSILFLISTANLAMFVAGNVELLQGDLVNLDSDQPLLERFQLTIDNVNRLNIAQTWLGGGGGGFLFVFADAVVVWRACVIWPGNKLARIIPLALLFASFGTATVTSALATMDIATSTIISTSSPTGIMLILGQSLSLATNLVATVLIGYKAYRHRQMMKITMGLKYSRSGAVLLILVESGVAFCILQIITIGTGVADNTQFSALDYTADVWETITTFAAAAYPVLVLIIVDNNCSISDRTRCSAGDSGMVQGSNAESLGVGSHLSFAVRPPGLSSSGGGVSEDSMAGYLTEPNPSKDRSNEGTVRVKDLEKGEGC